MTEHQLQSACFKLFNLQYPQHAGDYFAIPNGGLRNKRVAYKLKLEGVKPGVFDAFLSVPRATYAGLWIEFKTAKGRLSQEQKQFKERMENNGYKCEVAKSIDEFARITNAYLSKDAFIGLGAA